MEQPAGADDATAGQSSLGGTPGRRVVLLIYVASIATATVFGAVLGFMFQVQGSPSTGSFGPIAFPITPLTLAVFGTVTVGFVLTVGLLLVRVASNRET